MEDLVHVSKQFKGQLSTTSIKVAEAFDKRHDHVLRDIDNLLKHDIKGGLALFGETSYIHPQNGQEYRCFEMNEHAFILLVMGYTGGRAIELKVKYMAAFNKMKALLDSDEYIFSRALELASKRLEEKSTEIAQLQEANTFLESVIQEQAPDVAYSKKVLNAANAWNITTIAKELDTTAIDLNKTLCDMGIQYKHDKHYVLSARYKGRGFTKTKTYTYTNSLGETISNIQTTWTEKGRNFIHSLISTDNESRINSRAAQ